MPVLSDSRQRGQPGRETSGFVPAALDVLTLDGGKIATVTGFHAAGPDLFARVGLPARLP
jgi:hypothetical protein